MWLSVGVSVCLSVCLSVCQCVSIPICISMYITSVDMPAVNSQIPVYPPVVRSLTVPVRYLHFLFQ